MPLFSSTLHCIIFFQVFSLTFVKQQNINPNPVFVIFLFVSELPQHSLILDVRTRWNSLYLMLERFLEQYPAIQAASLDQRLRKNMERDR